MGVHHQYQPDWETNPGLGCWIGGLIVLNVGWVLKMWLEPSWDEWPLLVAIDVVALIGLLIARRVNRNDE